MADIAFFEGRAVTNVPPAYSVTGGSSLSLTNFNMDCNPVGSVIVTDIVQDQNSGDYVRDLRVFSPESNAGGPVLLLQVRLHALTVKALEIHTPPSTF